MDEIWLSDLCLKLRTYMKAEDLIQNQIKQIQFFIQKADLIKTYDLHTLTWRENEKSWTILECLAHLNLYGGYYLPLMEAKIKHAPLSADSHFKSGFLGKYFVKSMLGEKSSNRMKTPKSKNPINTGVGEEVINDFIGQQHKFLELLDQAQQVSLNKVKIPTSLSRFIKMNLGDTFQFLINHTLRHFQQMDRIYNTAKELKM